MARVLPADLAQIYPDVVEDVDSFTPFIETANLMITEELGSSGLSADRLKKIELYLAAHLACITLERGGLMKRKVGESEDTYQTPGFNTLGLVTTRFGQQVVILDTTGKMAALSQKPVKAMFRVHGDPNRC